MQRKKRRRNWDEEGDSQGSVSGNSSLASSKTVSPCGSFPNIASLDVNGVSQNGASGNIQLMNPELIRIEEDPLEQVSALPK